MGRMYHTSIEHRNKHAFDDVPDQSIQTDTDNLKKLIRIFRKGGLNENLPPGKALQQEIATRFGTTFDMVKRFIHSSSDVLQVLESSDQNAVKHASDAFDAIKSDNSTHPSFHAILKCFGPV